jgi:hypothetical protein
VSADARPRSYWVPLPGQASAPTPEGGWHFVPSGAPGDGGAGPLSGASGATPQVALDDATVPSASGSTTSTDSPSPSISEKGCSASIVIGRHGDGWFEERGCRSAFEWMAVGASKVVPGFGFRVQGTIVTEEGRTAAAEMDVVADRIATPSVAALRVVGQREIVETLVIFSVAAGACERRGCGSR